MSQANDPTAAAEGLPINTTVPEEYRDVFDYVLQRWRVANPALQTGTLSKMAEAFCTFAREEAFKHNSPVGMDYLGQSLALRFQDGLVLAFLDTDTGLPGVGGVPGGVDITKPEDASQREGTGATVRSASFGVTGNDGHK